MDFLVVVIVGRERDVIVIIVIIVLYGCGVIGDRTCVGVADEIVIFGKILVGGEDLIFGKILIGGEIVAQVAFEVLPIAEVDKIGVVKWV